MTSYKKSGRDTKYLLERQVQAKILKHLEELNLFNFKTITANKRGIPDIFVLVEGKPVFLEIKRNKYSKPSELQVLTLAKIEKAGGIARVVTSLEDVKQILNEINPDKFEYNIENSRKDLNDV